MEQKFKNTSEEDVMVAVDAGRKHTNGEPYTWWRVMHPNEVFLVKNEAVKGALLNPSLKKTDEPETIRHVVKKETDANPEEPRRGRGRPPKE